MYYNDLFTKLSYLTKRNNINQTELGNIISVDNRTMNARAIRNSKFKPHEIQQIENYFGIKFKDAHISSNTWQPVNNRKESFETAAQRLGQIQDELGYLNKAMARLMDIKEERYEAILAEKADITASELQKLTSKIDVSLDWLINGN